MKVTIEIDNDVQDIIIRNRKFFDEPSNEVLRRLLRLTIVTNEKLNDAGNYDKLISATSNRNGLTVKGVHFPEGLKLRKELKGRLIEAAVTRGYILCEGKKFKSPSGAAMHINGGTSVNGWNFWEYYDEIKGRWRPLNNLRSN